MINLEALQQLARDCSIGSQLATMEGLFAKYPHGTLLEAISIIHQKGAWANLGAFFALADRRTATDPAPDYLTRESYKLAALFGVVDHTNLHVFLH